MLEVVSRISNINKRKKMKAGGSALLMSCAFQSKPETKHRSGG